MGHLFDNSRQYRVISNFDIEKKRSHNVFSEYHKVQNDIFRAQTICKLWNAGWFKAAQNGMPVFYLDWISKQMPKTI